MSNLITRLTKVNARLKEIPARLGVPQYQLVVTELGQQQLLLTPNPMIMQLDPGKMEHWMGSNNVEVNAEYFSIQGIPRTYSLDYLRRCTYLIQAREITPGVYSGVRCDRIYINTNDLLEYSVVVKKARVR